MKPTAEPTREQREAAEKWFLDKVGLCECGEDGVCLDCLQTINSLAQLLAEREEKLMSALEDAIDTIAVYKAEKENDYVSLEEFLADSDEETP